MVDEDMPPLTPDAVAAAIEERRTTVSADMPVSSEMPPPPDDRPPRPWGLLVGVAAGLLVIFLLFRVALGGDGEAAPSTSTEAGGTTTIATTTSTVVPTTTTATTTSTTASSTTSTAPTTTSTTTTTLAPIEAVGTPIPITDLTLGAFALGPFTFDTGTSYLGRLVASLGQPDGRADVGTDMGLCEGDQGVAYTWGGLTAIFRVAGGTETLVGYRLVATTSDDPTQQIATRSGLTLGNTIERLNAIYLQPGLGFIEIDGKPHFILLRSTDNATLLWGPVSSADASGVVEGIYSPRPCDHGPAATP